MGSDGGTAPNRADLLRRASWKTSENDTSRSTRGGTVVMHQADPKAAAEHNETLYARWKYCALSNEELRNAELVCCRLGRLYNKSSVVEYLCKQERYLKNWKMYEAEFGHIKSLKDVFPICPTPNPDVSIQTTNATLSFNDVCQSSSANLCAPFVCPLRGTPSCPPHIFVALPRCGHCLDVESLKDVSDGACPVCGIVTAKEDQVFINPVGDKEKAANRETLKRWEEQKKKERKEKKEKKRKEKEEKKKEKNATQNSPTINGHEENSMTTKKRSRSEANKTELDANATITTKEELSEKKQRK